MYFNINKLYKLLWLPIGISILYLSAVFFRPLFPIDETRYMTVAWEMLLHKGWFKPLTVNFEPYHHKPPLLFWLINLSWAIFSTSRWAALLPIVLSSAGLVILTQKLGELLFPELRNSMHRIKLIVFGSAPFLLYGTLVMFDITLGVCVLLSLIFLVKYSQCQKWQYIMLIGLCIGLGVLTKGPVAYLYVIFPMVFAPFWLKEKFPGSGHWYWGCAAALFISVLPVLVWLIPVLALSDSNFAFWLVWNQTAGRITGNFEDAHIRPFVFYLPLLPLMVTPWIFFPNFWKGRRLLENNTGCRFLCAWLIPVFISFCLISGKQPHYLIPLLPGFALLVFVMLRNSPTQNLAIWVGLSLVVFAAGHAIAARSLLKSYDLQPIASYVHEHQDHEWAFVRNYHGEIGFLGRLEKPITNLSDKRKLSSWLNSHPGSMAVVRYSDSKEIDAYKIVADRPYRGRRIAIVSQKQNY